MRFEYRKLARFDNRPWKSRPMLEVRLFSLDLKKETPPILCLLDSGADNCIFDTQIGNMLEIDIKSGRTEKFQGIAPSPVLAYFHKIKYQISGLDKKYETEAAFMDNLTGGGLLGQEGFFDNRLTSPNALALGNQKARQQ